MTRQHIRILTVLLGAGLLGSGWPLAPVQAAGVVESAYTPLVLDKCGNVTPPDMEERGAVFRCQGYGGIAVRVAEGDLRMFVSYGDRAEDQTAASQTLPAFNATGETLEWRLEDGKPFATILRYHWDSDGLSRGSTLVVTKLDKADACHVAYVRAEENPNANALAREIADEDARRFSCERDRPRTYGAGGQPID
jgi:hypothetical protein